jgi:hypothetical protein
MDSINGDEQMLDEVINDFPVTLSDWYRDLVDDYKSLPIINEYEVEGCLDGGN